MPLKVEELKSSGPVSIHYPPKLRQEVENAVHSWIEFCKLPTEEKTAFAFLEDTHGDGAGYELKMEKASKKDLKENFHVTLFQHPRLTEISNKKTFPFLHDAKVLLDGIEPMVIEFAQDLEKEYGIRD